MTLFIHGGGFCIGHVDTADGFCRSPSEEAESLVVSVEYRRGQKHRSLQS